MDTIILIIIAVVAALLIVCYLASAVILTQLIKIFKIENAGFKKIFDDYTVFDDYGICCEYSFWNFKFRRCFQYFICDSNIFSISLFAKKILSS